MSHFVYGSKPSSSVGVRAVCAVHSTGQVYYNLHWYKLPLCPEQRAGGDILRILQYRYCKPLIFRDTKCLRFSNLDRLATYYFCDFEFFHLYVRVLVHSHS